MATTANSKKKKVSAKKALAQKVSTQLNTVLLSTLKKLLGKKKLDKRISKASKLLVAGIKTDSAKKQKSPRPKTVSVRKKA